MLLKKAILYILTGFRIRLCIKDVNWAQNTVRESKKMEKLIVTVL